MMIWKYVALFLIAWLAISFVLGWLWTRLGLNRDDEDHE